LSACRSLRRVENKLVVIYLRDLGGVTNVSSSVGIDKLSIKWDIVAQGTIVILELAEANSADFDASLA